MTSLDFLLLVLGISALLVIIPSLIKKKNDKPKDSHVD